MKFILAMGIVAIQTVALLSSTASAKNNYVVKEEKNLKSPNVQAYTCSSCVWDDGLDFLCMDTSATLEVGWEVLQT